MTKWDFYYFKSSYGPYINLDYKMFFQGGGQTDINIYTFVRQKKTEPGKANPHNHLLRLERRTLGSEDLSFLGEGGRRRAAGDDGVRACTSGTSEPTCAGEPTCPSAAGESTSAAATESEPGDELSCSVRGLPDTSLDEQW